MEIIAATGNRNKIAELSAVGREYGIVIVAPEDLRRRLGLPDVPEVAETGSSYLENARLKAEAFVKWSGIPALGDDSGLEVKALGGRPGLHSARYAGAGSSDQQKIAKLLSELEQLGPAAERTAHYRCVLVLKFPDGSEVTAESLLPGEVLQTVRGSAGFGYDPIIKMDNLGRTLAEVDFETTVKDGFRPVAARRLFSCLLAR